MARRNKKKGKKIIRRNHKAKKRGIKRIHYKSPRRPSAKKSKHKKIVHLKSRRGNKAHKNAHKKTSSVTRKVHAQKRKRKLSHYKIAPHMHNPKRHVFHIDRPPVVFVKPDVNDLICRGYSPKEIVHKFKSTPTDFALSYVHPRYLVEAGFSLEQMINAGRVRWHSPLGSHASNYNEAFNLCRYLTDHHVSVEKLRQEGAKLSDLAVGAVHYAKLKAEGFRDRDILTEIQRHFSESDNAFHWAHLNFERLSSEGMPGESFIGFESLGFLVKRRVALDKLLRLFSPKQLLHFFKPMELISKGISLRKMGADEVSLYWAYQNGVPLSQFKKEGFSVLDLVTREHDGFMFEHYAPLAREFPPRQIEDARKQGFEV